MNIQYEIGDTEAEEEGKEENYSRWARVNEIRVQVSYNFLLTSHFNYWKITFSLPIPLFSDMSAFWIAKPFQFLWWISLSWAPDKFIYSFLANALESLGSIMVNLKPELEENISFVFHIKLFWCQSSTSICISCWFWRMIQKVVMAQHGFKISYC